MPIISCENCDALNTDDASACCGCGLPLGFADAATGPVMLSSRYKLLAEVGRGGMGFVYKAYDTALEETVALKLLRPEIATSEKMAASFRSEIRLARRIAHRNVCRIFEYGEDRGTRYISMEFVEGRDLRRVLRHRAALDVGGAVHLIVQIAEGLQAIHDAGVIHRDLKAANVMVALEGTVKLMDFGIAKEWHAERGWTTGGLMGTPEYMSPEQILGEKIDCRSDLYSLGILMYEIFAGDVPFREATPTATLFRHVNGPSPFDDKRRLPATLPPALLEVCRRCLARRPEDRYASAREVAEAVRASIQLPQARPAADRPTLTLGSEAFAPLVRYLVVRQATRRMAIGLGAAAVVATLIVGRIGGGSNAPSAPAAIVARPAATALPAAPKPSSASGTPQTVVSAAAAADRRAPTRIVAATAAPTKIAPATVHPAATLAPTVAAAPAAAPTAAAPVESEVVSSARAEARSVEAHTPESLRHDLSSPDAAIRARALERAASAGRSGVTVLADALRTGPAAVRAESAAALGRMGRDAEGAVPALMAALRDPDGHVRASAASALGRVGAVARDAVPWLRDMLRDDDERARAAAADALARIAAPQPETVAALLRAIKDDSPRVRALAAHALGQAPELTPAIVSALQKALKDKHEMVRRSAEKVRADRRF